MMIFPDFLKQHTPAFEGAMIFTCKNMSRELFTSDLKFPDFFNYFFSCKQLTGFIAAISIQDNA